jgi:hypothetical protein
MKAKAKWTTTVAGLGAFALAACGGGSSGSPAAPTDAAPPTDGAPPQTPDDFMAALKGDQSCVFNCDPSCPEGTMPWQCPALADWSTIPHDPTACGAFDGKTFPAPTTGACSATAPSGEALAKTSYEGTPTVLPDGRRVIPEGTEWLFDATDVPGGFPSSSYLVPGTKWLIVDDTGYDVHAVRVIDTTVLRAGGTTSPVVSEIKFPPPSALNWGIAYAAATNVLYLPSGVPDSKIFAFDLNTTTGQLTQDASKTIALGAEVLPQAVALSPDGKTLLVGPATGTTADPKLGVLVYSVDAATYGTQKGTISLGTTDVFGVAFDPNDATGNAAYATLWHSDAVSGDSSKMVLAQLDVAGSRATAIAVGKEPEGFVFLNGRYMVVANGFSDSLTIVDRPAGMVATTVQLLATPQTSGRGVEPTLLAWDQTHSRLYATLASANGIAAFDVDTTQTPPQLTPAGTIATAWWPTSVIVDPADGTLYVTNGRGHGSVALEPVTGADDSHLMRGSVQAVPYMNATAIGAATSRWQANTQVAAILGYSTVQCNNGAPYDFPVPQKTTDGPSAKIQHIVFVVRENKTFDALFGDMQGVDGDPTRVMRPGMQDEVWPNARTFAPGFAHMDNFYEDAEQSAQGHYWTVYGRTSDIDERRWLVTGTWGRGELALAQLPGIFDDSSPLEGSVFTVLGSQGVTVANMGELLDGFHFGPYVDHQWPGGSSSTTIPDSPAACYAAARARVLCNLPQFTYAWLGNDHTFGLAAGKPNPALMIAENDEATGMLLDGLSHSPMWPSTLFVVVEDDPSDGTDHVDQHRTIALFASPWIKRGYVSHAHYDMASVHKLFAHVFGKPYANEVIANAPLPLDLFTSTPDYTPYNYIPRKVTDISCNPMHGKGAEKAARWDFSLPDNQPGLSEQVEEALRGGGGADR